MALSPESCELADELRKELHACSADKDKQLNTLSEQVRGMHVDLSRIDGDIKTLTNAVTDISKALDTIAANTTAISDVLLIYQNFKGFTAIMKYIGIAVVGLSALATAIIYLGALHITIKAG